MIRIRYLKSSALAEVRENVSLAIEPYSSNKPFLEDYFKNRSDWLCDSSLSIQTLPELDTGDNGAIEAANAIAIHRGFIGLSPSQAADERLWAWLAHGPYWDYMQKRWPTPSAKGKAVDFVMEHYFIGRNVRNLVRHGISRLWWFAQTTYDDKREDPYELTKVMLEFSDNRQSVMERAFSRNREFVQSLLDRAHHWRSQGRDVLGKRDQFRSLCKEMNLNGGTLMLDCLARAEIYELVDDYIARAVPA
jgi:hypothetical protein